MRCTRAAVDNQTFKGCGQGYEDTNECKGKRKNKEQEQKKCERGHLNPHRVTGDLVESNFTLNIVVVSLFLALFCALRRVGMKSVLGKGQYEPKWKQKQWRKKGEPSK